METLSPSWMLSWIISLLTGILLAQLHRLVWGLWSQAFLDLGLATHLNFRGFNRCVDSGRLITPGGLVRGGGKQMGVSEANKYNSLRFVSYIPCLMII